MKDEQLIDPREKFKEAYTWLINTHFATPIWNQTVETMLQALDEELNKRSTTPTTLSKKDILKLAEEYFYEPNADYLDDRLLNFARAIIAKLSVPRFTNEQILIGARELSDRHARICNTNEDDNWLHYSESYVDEVKAIISIIHKVKL